MKYITPISSLLAILVSLSTCALTNAQTYNKVRHKPVVFALGKNPTDADHLLTDETQSEKFSKELLKRKLKLKEFKTFDLVYAGSILGIEDATRQAQLLDEAAALLKDGNRVLHVSDLSPDAQATVRGMFMAIPGPAITITGAQQPDLRLMAGLHSTVTAHFGDKQATYSLASEPNIDQWKEAMNPPPAKLDPDTESKTKDKPKFAFRPPTSTPFLVFVFSTASTQLERLQYLGEVQQYLRDECMIAKQKFDAAAKKAMASVYKDFASRYDRFKNLESNPSFHDLSAEDQRKCGELFALSRDRDLFPDFSDAQNFLNFAKTDSFRTEFALSLMVPVEIGANNTTIPISCPVHP